MVQRSRDIEEARHLRAVQVAERRSSQEQIERQNRLTGIQLRQGPVEQQLVAGRDTVGRVDRQPQFQRVTAQTSQIVFRCDRSPIVPVRYGCAVPIAFVLDDTLEERARLLVIEEPTVAALSNGVDRLNRSIAVEACLHGIDKEACAGERPVRYRRRGLARRERQHRGDDDGGGTEDGAVLTTMFHCRSSKRPASSRRSRTTAPSS